ncbi:uncharacterized protein [Antennarius striatus]|uniref:uncharacterized protein n=1 Tax=Antennarius striatus TaxID=241820 RepID=UPI0035AE7AF7
MCSMILWDRHDILGAVLSWWLIPVLSFYMLYISYSNLIKYKTALSIISPGVIPWTRYLTQNGLAAFAWWSLLHATVGFGILLKYKAGMLDALAGTAVLTIVCLSTLIWFVLQSFLLSKYLRSTFSVYAILILGLGSMFTRNYSVSDLPANTVYCGFLMVLMTILSSVHLISECLRENESSKPVALEPYVTFECSETVSKPAGAQK